MYKGSVYLDIPIIGMVIAIWDEVFLKLIVSFDGLVSSKKVLSEYSHRIETHIDVVVEILEVHSIIAFELCLDEKFIDFF